MKVGVESCDHVRGCHPSLGSLVSRPFFPTAIFRTCNFGRTKLQQHSFGMNLYMNPNAADTHFVPKWEQNSVEKVDVAKTITFKC